MQLDYSQNLGVAVRGQLGDTQFKKTESLLAKEQLELGQGMVKFQNSNTGMRLPIANLVALQADADLITDNSTLVTVIITKFDGTSVTNTTTATVFAASHAASMEAIAVKIRLFSGISGVTVTDTNDRTLSIVADPDVTLSGVTGTTTLGGSQAAWTATYDTADSMYAVSHHEHGIEVAGPPNTMRITRVLLTLSTALITANVFAGRVMGTSYTETYASSSAATLAILALEIEANAAVSTVTVNAAGTVLTINAAPGYSLRVNSWAVTLGASQATVTQTDQRLDGDDSVVIEAAEMVNGLRRGVVWVLTEVAVDTDDPVYLRFLTSGVNVPGNFLKTADSSTAFLIGGAVWKKSAAAGAVAPIEINLP